jgi:hypothetical protein
LQERYQRVILQILPPTVQNLSHKVW